MISRTTTAGKEIKINNINTNNTNNKTGEQPANNTASKLARHTAIFKGLISSSLIAALITVLLTISSHVKAELPQPQQPQQRPQVMNLINGFYCDDYLNTLAGSLRLSWVQADQQRDLVNTHTQMLEGVSHGYISHKSLALQLKTICSINEDLPLEKARSILLNNLKTYY